MTRTGPPAVVGPGGSAEPVDSFRARLLRGLMRSIEERGYRDTTITDIVRHARASRSTFYKVFATKDECLIALLQTSNADLIERMLGAVDPAAPWRRQVSQAVDGYIGYVASQPALSRCWIRELYLLGEVGEQLKRQAFDTIAGLVQQRSHNVQFQRGGIAPLSRELTLIILGGVLELVATVLEEGGDVRSVQDVCTTAATALVATSRV